jgi:hypothetical protein
MKEDLSQSELAPGSITEVSRSRESSLADVALVTGGKDKHYAVGLSGALVEKGIPFEFLGSNYVDSPSLHDNPLITYRNLRGDQAENAPLGTKVRRVLIYYARLLRYAATARPRVFHVLWNNKFEWFDRTLLLLFYKMCGRKIVHTAHNVNIGERDGSDSFLNRLTLKIQYRLVDDIFVHTNRMKEDLERGFQIPSEKIHVMPFPLNDAVPDTALEGSTARASLGIDADERVLLAYGSIAPYKGLEYLVEALTHLPKDGVRYRLLIARRDWIRLFSRASNTFLMTIPKSISRPPTHLCFPIHTSSRAAFSFSVTTSVCPFSRQTSAHSERALWSPGPDSFFVPGTQRISPVQSNDSLRATSIASDLYVETKYASSL